jgi:hypothetical protein
MRATVMHRAGDVRIENVPDATIAGVEHQDVGADLGKDALGGTLVSHIGGDRGGERSGPYDYARFSVDRRRGDRMKTDDFRVWYMRPDPRPPYSPSRGKSGRRMASD